MYYYDEGRRQASEKNCATMPVPTGRPQGEGRGGEREGRGGEVPFRNKTLKNDLQSAGSLSTKGWLHLPVLLFSAGEKKKKRKCPLTEPADGGVYLPPYPPIPQSFSSFFFFSLHPSTTFASGNHNPRLSLTLNSSNPPILHPRAPPFTSCLFFQP